MSGKVNSTGARSGVLGTTVGTPAGVAGTEGFAASGTSNWSVLAAGAICPFNLDSGGNRYDTGGNYNTSSYKYEVPSSGYYIFNFGIYTGEADTLNRFGFETNSGEVDVHNNGDNYFVFSNSNEDKVLTGTVIIYLADTQTIWVYASGQSDFHAGSSYWQGCRLN